ncbi:MAG: branched chain amino acid ABC transporter substrate-binding protein [Ferrovum sp. 37-45-19]|uniref:branched-chain amino acid ABC transporter substrate-binding protein n=1 Tax=Ferrovum sp. JA12 TaxID=1356299 RepID=UPI000702B0CB|nr:branched-chain amino acid ABC transporter substrate-binding protein [Ferrovum sp. JA12]OYV79430.1 MAG: branched chain amino acid ABC transporter substrate-binding protein [Ferrovum sp. 21-44-67]OYV94991.1 MAG: branched chain amino acid ABC transporter substrate-binding protein [Ferrovum sp. 37-45-19]OZB34235.1 MAG: branched chain amino acid ABC transporter substrate-binding protein [Ferrovum sp. 34-44-207]HQT80954.1 branched-chain amino acid ABC transporter substrate-binding protein [Ferrova
MINIRPLIITLAVALCVGSVTAEAKDTVKIGFIGPLTGGNSAIGIGGRNSAQLAVDLKNKESKTKYHYELVVLDDECKPSTGVQVATKMASDNSIVAGVTHFCSSVAMATLNTYHRFDFPIIVWGAVLPDITYKQNYAQVHRVNGTMITQNQVAARFMTDLKYTRFVIVHDTTDYGKGHEEYFTQDIKSLGGTILGSFGVPVDQQDFTTELTKIKELKPQVIFFGGLTPLGVRIRNQMEKMGIHAQFEGTSGIKSDAFIEGVGKDVAEGSLSFLEGAPAEKLSGGKFFLEQYKAEKFNEPPEAYGPFAFTATNLIIDAVEKMGPNRNRVNQELNKTNNVNTIIGKVTFDDHRQNIVPLVSAYVVQDGQWVLWEDSQYATKKRKLK